MLQARARRGAGAGQAEGPVSSSRLFFSLRERDAAGAGGDEQRLDAERVARAEQHPLLGVPDQEGEHPAQPRHRVGPQWW